MRIHWLGELSHKESEIGMILYALFAITEHRKELVAVFAKRSSAVEFATMCGVESWHIQEVPYTEV